MFKKITALLLAVIICAGLLCACKEKDKKPGATVSPTAALENGNETDITTAVFDYDKIKVGDRISVFTVSQVDIKKHGDGTLASAMIKFSGSLAVRGSYTLTDTSTTADYDVFDEYAEYLPYPAKSVNEFKTVGLDAEKIKAVYGEAESGYAAVVLESYSLTYSVEDGEWHAFADSFSKDETEYSVMQ